MTFRPKASPKEISSLIGSAYKDGVGASKADKEPEAHDEAAEIAKEANLLLPICKRWVQTVPERVLRNAQPARVRFGVLYVNTRTAPWAQELTSMKTSLLAAIRKATNNRIIDIRFQVGPLPLPGIRQSEPVRHVDPTKVNLHSVPQETARVLASIPDDELRQALLLAACATLEP